MRVLAGSRLASRRDKRLLYPLQAGLDCSALYAFARQWRPQVAHFFLPGPYLLGAPVAMAAQIPIKVMSRRSLAQFNGGTAKEANVTGFPRVRRSLPAST